MSSGYINFEPPAQNKKGDEFFHRLFRAPSGARTQDPNIKSVVLYQLS